jgi:hypothetical protein
MTFKNSPAFQRLTIAFCTGMLLFPFPSLAQNEMPSMQAPVNVIPVPMSTPAPTSALINSSGASPMDLVTAGVTDIDPETDTHPLIRLTPDKSEIIRLDRGVRSLIVGNPMHLNVLLDSTKTLVLVPREPGATHFTALDDQGQVIMQRHVIVGSPKENYIRVRRSCANAGGGDCVETSVYYCPDMCHPVGIMSADQGQPSAIAATSGASAGNISMPDAVPRASPSAPVVIP